MNQLTRFGFMAISETEFRNMFAEAVYMGMPMDKDMDGRSVPDAVVTTGIRDIRDDEEFCGLFIFEFDEEGRILSHTIEHADENRHWEKTSKFVSITDWLLGRMNGKGKEKEPELAWEFAEDRSSRHVHRRVLRDRGVHR